MMRRAVLVLTVVVAPGCALYVDEPPGGDVEPISCELHRESYTHHRAKLDLLFVVDTSPAMAGHREDLIANLAHFAFVLENIEGGHPSVHVGVTSSDIACEGTGGGVLTAEPTLAGCDAPDGTYLIDEVYPWYTCGSESAPCGSTNYEGAFSDTLACMTALPAGTCETRQPLAAAVSALTSGDASAAGFLRDDAYLMVVVIAAGDDSSPGAVTDYLTTLAALRPDDGMVLTSVIAPSSAVRLRTFAEENPQRGVVVDIAWENWSDAFSVFADLGAALLGYSCFPELDPTDTDPTSFGLQPTCSVVLPEDPDTQIPACAMSAPERPHSDTTLPCWWIARDEYDCSYHPVVEGAEWAEWRCAATCDSS